MVGSQERGLTVAMVRRCAGCSQALAMSLDIATCPICGRDQPAVPRYPDYVCRECVERVADAGGRPLGLFNTSLSGGFVARYADSDELAAEESVTHLVYVDGVRCYADEARFRRDRRTTAPRAGLQLAIRGRGDPLS